MRGPRNTRNLTTRRGLMLLGAQLAVIGGLGWRMRQLQVEQSDRYRLLAEENRINIRLIAPARGLIMDRNGVLLAGNKQNYRVVMVREQAGDVAGVLRALSSLIALSDERQAAVMTEMRKRKPFVPVTVIDHLTWEEIARVAANAPALPGVTTEVGLSRHYPERHATAHIVGYVGPVSERDLSRLDDPDPLLQIPKFQIGKTGVEQRIEKRLRGAAGTSRIEVNAVGRVMRELGRADGTAGSDLHLTLDNSLQNYAMKRMEGESATSVVIDVTNGDLLAMASAPSFDPNSFVFGISVKDWNSLLNNDYRPLSNKSVSGAYPPGSTFKMVVALAALQAGEIGPGETVYCPGFYKLGNRRFHCWRGGGHGHVDLQKSLEQSCDVYYYDIARRVGIEKITEMARRLGLGIRHDLPLPAVAEGLTPTKSWKERVHDEAWLIGDTLNSGIGQGFTLASPLQLAVMTARIATGKMVVPRLVRAEGGIPTPVPSPQSLGLSPAQLDWVKQGMYAVSNHRRGTGYRSRIVDPEVRMGGKTGTSQVRMITVEERARGVFKNKDLPWNRRDHALFVAFAPFDAPRYAIATVVEHGGGGSVAAAPIARDVLMHALYGPEPPLAAYPANQRPEIERRRLEEETQPPTAEAGGPQDRA